MMFSRLVCVAFAVDPERMSRSEVICIFVVLALGLFHCLLPCSVLKKALGLCSYCCSGRSALFFVFF